VEKPALQNTGENWAHYGYIHISGKEKVNLILLVVTGQKLLTGSNRMLSLH